MLLLWDVVAEKAAQLRLAGVPVGRTGTGPLGVGLGSGSLSWDTAVGVQPAWVRRRVMSPVFRSVTRDSWDLAVHGPGRMSAASCPLCVLCLPCPFFHGGAQRLHLQATSDQGSRQQVWDLLRVN